MPQTLEQTVLPNEKADQALVPSPRAPAPTEAIEPDGVVARLPVEVDVAVAVRNFRVRNLLALERGTLVESQWPNGEDVPLATGDVQLAWSEFEVADTRLAVRLTRLV